MGVYYDAKLVWGLRVSSTEETRENDLTGVYDLPAGFRYSEGGDFMSGENMAFVVHPPRATTTILDTMDYSGDGFGVKSVDEIYNPTPDDVDTLVAFARQHGLDEDIGWFTVSSVG